MKNDLSMVSPTFAWRALLALNRLVAPSAAVQATSASSPQATANGLRAQRYGATEREAWPLAAAPETTPKGDGRAGAPYGAALPLHEPSPTSTTLGARAPDETWIEFFCPDTNDAATSTYVTWHWRAMVGERPLAESGAHVAPEARHILDLYLPMVLAASPAGSPGDAPGDNEMERPYIIAHLAQSIDGRIATEAGISQWITGAIDQAHNHRMRALCDAVLVGAETVIHDDPRLTCRQVEGPHPIRVVLDPKGRVTRDRHLFRDGAAPTLILTTERASARSTVSTEPAEPAEPIEHAPTADHVSTLVLASNACTIAPQTIARALAARGIRRLYIEGGGVTVSAFLQAQLIDRLQLAVAPMLIGSGRPSVALPTIHSLEHALRPTVRRFDFGADVLFECVFHPEGPARPDPGSAAAYGLGGVPGDDPGDENDDGKDPYGGQNGPSEPTS